MVARHPSSARCIERCPPNWLSPPQHLAVWTVVPKSLGRHRLLGEEFSGLRWAALIHAGLARIGDTTDTHYIVWLGIGHIDDAAVISRIMSLTRALVRPTSCTKLEPATSARWHASVRSLIASALMADHCLRSRLLSPLVASLPEYCQKLARCPKTSVDARGVSTYESQASRHL